MRTPFVWIRRGLRSPVVRILIIAVCYAIYLDREHVWEFLKEHTWLPDILEALNPQTIAWLKQFDAELFETCGQVVEPWCLPNIDAVLEMFNNCPMRIEGSKYQATLFRIFGFFVQWPRAWPTILMLLDPGNNWTASFCESAIKTDYLKQLMLLDIVRYPRYTWGELKTYHKDVAALWEQWFNEMRSLNSKRLHSLLNDALSEGDDSFLGSRSMVELIQFQHSKTMSHLLTVACPEGAKALIESDSGNVSLLHVLAREGNTDMVELLVKIRPEADQKDYVTMMDPSGYTAEQLARLAHFNDTASVLRMLAGSSDDADVPVAPPWPPVESDAGEDGHEFAYEAGWDIDSASAVPQEWLPAAGESQCFADVVDADEFNWTHFVNHYDLRSRPLLIRGGAKHPRAKRAYTRAGLLEAAGRVRVETEDYPYAGFQVNTTPTVTTIKNYAEYLKKRREDGQQANRLEILVKDVMPKNYSQRNLSFVFFLPQLLERRLVPFNTQFFLGGDLTGTPFRYGDNTFISLVYGRTLWLMHPPSKTSWINDAMYRYMQRTNGAPGALRCIQEAGDLFFVPRGWTRGTMCLSDCIGTEVEYTLDDHGVLPEYEGLSIHHDPYQKQVTKLKEKRYIWF